jgi:hypothetical protein
MNPHEQAFVEAFVQPTRRERAEFCLSNPKKRHEFINKFAHHGRDVLIPQHLKSIERSHQNPKSIYGLLRGLGVFLHTAISADDSKLFFNQDGAVFSVDTTNDHLTFAVADPACCYGDYDLTLSSGQTTLEATSYLYDTNLNAASYLVLNDQEASYIAYVYGVQLSPDGMLLFQPSTDGFDVYDGQLGVLLSRIALPFEPFTKLRLACRRWPRQHFDRNHRE